MLFVALLLIVPFSVVSSGEHSWKEVFLQTDQPIPPNVSPQCINDSSTWINSLKIFAEVSTECLVTKKCSPEEKKLIKDNKYAIEQLDAFGKLPSTGLFDIPLLFDGSYDECERVNGVKYDTNYCYLIMLPGRNNSCDNALSMLNLRAAVCMPRSCNTGDLTTMFNSMSKLPLKACYATCVHRDVEKDSAFWGYSVFLLIIVAFAIFASIFDFIRETVYEVPSAKETNLVRQIILTFSLWTNANLILSVKEQKVGFIKCLDCIRLFSMLWVVTGHTYLYFVPPKTLMSISDFMTHFWNHLLLNAFLSVDTFFLLSGIVVSYLFFKTRPKSSMMRNPITWILFYVHRFLRLTPPIMLFIGFFVVYAKYIQGPFSAADFNQLTAQVNSCKKNWWYNLLYINNFVDKNEMCYGISWYLAVDTQLYLVAPLFLIAFYFSITAGIISIIAGCVGSIVATYIIYGVYDFTADAFGNGESDDFFNVIYSMPWIRCTPYLVGLFVGYMLAVYGKRQIRLNWAISVAIWIVAFGIAAACLFSTYDYDKGSHWSVFSRGTFYNFSRFGWAIAVSWVIVANHMGWGGPINSFMSHPIWQPFGRLSYCAYIVHWYILFYVMNVGGTFPQFYSTWQVFVNYAIPATFFSYVFAFFWSCLFEIPILKLEKMLVQSIIGSIGRTSDKVGNDTKEGINSNRKRSQQWDIKM